jgi:hypothetical protein
MNDKTIQPQFVNSNLNDMEDIVIWQLNKNFIK